MATVLIIVLILLGLGLGFILAWILNVTGAAITLVIGLLLVVAGALAGFIIEWLIDESVRKNRDLQRQLAERQQGAPIVVEGNVIPPSRDSELLVEVVHQLRALREMPAVAAGTLPKQDDGMLAEILRQHNQELHQLGERISAKDIEIDEIRRRFEAYQKSHPDEFTQIKGIGPVFQRKLRDIGFSSFSQLAQADPAQLRRMLDIKDWQRVDVENWVQQARDWAEHR